jgi:hypothetical protein
MSFRGCEHTYSFEHDEEKQLEVKYTNSICPKCQQELIEELDTVRKGIRQNPNAYAYVIFKYMYDMTTEVCRENIIKLYLNDLPAFMRIINCVHCNGRSLYVTGIHCECLRDTYNTPEC